MNPVQSFDPDGRLLEELLDLLLLAKILLRILVVVTTDSVGVVGFVIKDQQVLLPADFLPDHPLDPLRVAFDVPVVTNRYLRQPCLAVPLLVHDFEDADRLFLA